MALKIGTRTSPEGVVVIDVAGRVVFGDEANALRDTVRNLLPDKKNIVLNLGEVSYIDSGGIGTLVALFTSVSNVGGKIKLVNLTKRVDDLLQITKLVTVFETYESEIDAIRSFATAAKA